MRRRGEALCGTHTVAVPPSFFSPFSPFPSPSSVVCRHWEEEEEEQRQMLPEQEKEEEMC